MRIIAAYLLAVLGGIASPTPADLKKILGAVEVSAENQQLEEVCKDLNGKNVEELVQLGSAKFASLGGSGAAVQAGGAAAPAAGAASAPAGGKKEEPKEDKKKKEEKVEEDEDESAGGAGMGGLFGDEEEF